MAILSIYSQHDQCFVALKLHGTLYQDSLTIIPGMTQATVLVPFIQRVWQQAEKPALSTIITPRGPGAFTSLRVALATAQGLACVFPNAQIFAPTHFEVLAYAGLQHSDYNQSILALIDSKRGEWYGQVYHHDLLKELAVSEKSITILNASLLQELLYVHPDYNIVADFTIDEKFKKYTLTDLGNISVVQIQLFEEVVLKKDHKLPPCYQQFKPYYLYHPDYVKKNKVLN
jgi:tRNA threonylcarbamoyl adenosine modification protein YeaZ